MRAKLDGGALRAALDAGDARAVRALAAGASFAGDMGALVTAVVGRGAALEEALWDGLVEACRMPFVVVGRLPRALAAAAVPEGREGRAARLRVWAWAAANVERTAGRIDLAWVVAAGHVVDALDGGAEQLALAEAIVAAADVADEGHAGHAAVARMRLAFLCANEGDWARSRSLLRAVRETEIDDATSDAFAAALLAQLGAAEIATGHVDDGLAAWAEAITRGAGPTPGLVWPRLRVPDLGGSIERIGADLRACVTLLGVRGATTLAGLLRLARELERTARAAEAARVRERALAWLAEAVAEVDDDALATLLAVAENLEANGELHEAVRLLERLRPTFAGSGQWGAIDAATAALRARLASGGPAAPR
jgi:tetratricopeptide (TPR) repeat protein